MTEKANIGALTIDLLLENKQFKAETRKIEGDTKAFAQRMVTTVTQIQTKFGTISTPLKNIPVSGFERFSTKAKAILSSFATGAKSILNGLKNFIFSWKTLVAAALVAAFTVKAITAIKNFAKGIIEASSSYEQLRLTLKVLLKDQDKANAAFDEARKLAANTAFSIEEITRAYTQMLTFGFDQSKIPETLLLAADAATAFGQNLDEVIRSINYLKAGRKGEALESLTRFGISRPELTKRGAKFSAGGELETSTEETLNIVFKIWEEKLGGMSKEGTKTWKGMVSNLKDAWTDFQATIGEAGFFDVVKNSLKFILDKINEWSANGTLKKWADDISARMANIYNGVVAIVKEITGLELTGGKTQIKEAKKMTTEEIALFVLGFTPEQFKNAMAFMSGGPGEGRSYIGVTSDADRQKVVDDATKLGEAIHAAMKGELDTGDYFTEAIGTEATGQVPGWAQTFIDWIEKIKEKIKHLWDSFTVGVDKRGSKDQHGIVSGMEGLSTALTNAITGAIEKIDFGKIIGDIIKKGENLAAVGEAAQAIGGAIGDGIVAGLSEKYPTVSAILKAAFKLSGVLNPLGLMSDFENVLDNAGLRVSQL
jgi:hypothetical protein